MFKDIIYLFKVNKENTRTICDISLNLTIKSLFWYLHCSLWTDLTHFFDVSIVDFEQLNVSCDGDMPEYCDTALWKIDNKLNIKYDNCENQVIFY